MSSEDYCQNAYEAYFQKFQTDHPNNDVRKARKYAIGQTILSAIKKYPQEDPVSLWQYVKKAHYKNFLGFDVNLSDETIEKIISARQSWVKSSGHAFEENIKEECNNALKDTDIVVLLQRDLTPLIKKQKLSNFQHDIDWLKKECEEDVFDLFVATKLDDEMYKVWGVIQAKTSIRDRVSRDREPSIRAMKEKFWSVIFDFDASFLHQPKFIAMVNGGSQEFVDNGWHSAYTYEKGYVNGRIKYIGDNMEVFLHDAIDAEPHFNGEQRSFVSRKYPFM